MQYLRQRYYDTSVGRFASVDPFSGLVELPVSRHRYLYGNANPVSYIDPSGEFSLSNLGATSAIIGILSSQLNFAQFFVSGAISDAASRVEWNGWLSKVSVDTNWGLGLSVGAAWKIESSTYKGQKLELPWGFALIGSEFSYDFSRGAVNALSAIPDISLHGTFVVETPSVFGLKWWTLAGGYSEIAAGASAAYAVSYTPVSAFTLGFGVGNSNGAGYGFSNNLASLSLSLFSGFSVPWGNTVLKRPEPA